jgi:hypothetical protein
MIAHDRFGEVIEIIGGKSGHRIDIGSDPTRCNCGCWSNRAIGGREHDCPNLAMDYVSVAGIG